MATPEQIQARIDAIDAKIASGLSSVTTSDGKSATLDDIEGLERRRALLVRQLSSARRGNRVSYVGMK